MVQDIKIVRRSYQADRKPSDKELSAWEAETGFKLPDDYRRFLTEWNGGMLLPYVFTHDHSEAQAGEHLVLKILNDWDATLNESQLDIDPELRTVPPDHLVIGCDPADVDILLCLSPEGYARIRTWHRNLDQSWGEAGNTQLGEVAESFSAFLGKLREGGTDLYHSFWSRPENLPTTWGILRI